jgi:hypothetical protein
VQLLAHVREERAAPGELEVADLSTDGCRFRGDFHFEQATRVWLKIPGLTARRAVIAWSVQGEAGCEFDDPLAEQTLRDFLERVGDRQSARPRLTP